MAQIPHQASHSTRRGTLYITTNTTEERIMKKHTIFYPRYTKDEPNVIMAYWKPINIVYAITYPWRTFLSAYSIYNCNFNYNQPSATFSISKCKKTELVIHGQTNEHRSQIKTLITHRSYPLVNIKMHKTYLQHELTESICIKSPKVSSFIFMENAD